METANAVFSQTYPYFEWIIVDDGSKDEESLKELAKLEKMDKRIKVFHKENGGPSVARDFGIENSSKDTKYIFFLDCDDIPDHTMLESLYWTLETHEDASFAYTTMVNFGDREFIWEKYLTVEQEIVEMRLAVIKEYMLKGILPLDDLVVSLNCVPVDCDTLDKCKCSGSVCGYPIAHFQIPQILFDYGLGKAIKYIGSSDR